jgi:hypothetical protein
VSRAQVGVRGLGYRDFVTIGSIAVRAGHVEDDGCVAIFLSHGREGAEDQAIDVGDDGGAARGDAAFGEEIVQGAERFVEGFCGLKLFAFADERCEEGEVVLGLLLGASVIEAKNCGRAGGELAAASFEGAMLAAWRCECCGFNDDAGLSGVHFLVLKGEP